MMAVERGVAIPDRRSVAFGHSFLNSVSRFGRVFEFGSVINYKLRTGDLFSDIDKAISMFTKGKLSLIPRQSGRGAEGTPELKGFLLLSSVKVGAVFGMVLLGVAFVTWVERRQSALHQDRRGPNRVGPFGMFQPIADGIKNFVKEEIRKN